MKKSDILSLVRVILITINIISLLTSPSPSSPSLSPSPAIKKECTLLGTWGHSHPHQYNQLFNINTKSSSTSIEIFYQTPKAKPPIFHVQKQGRCILQEIRLLFSRKRKRKERINSQSCYHDKNSILCWSSPPISAMWQNIVLLGDFTNPKYESQKVTNRIMLQHIRTTENQTIFNRILPN